MMLTIYPTQSEIMALAAKAGVANAISRSRLNVSREVLEAAGRHGMFDGLVGALLGDQNAGAIHARVRALVGEAWLLENGLR